MNEQSELMLELDDAVSPQAVQSSIFGFLALVTILQHTGSPTDMSYLDFDESEVDGRFR